MIDNFLLENALLLSVLMIALGLAFIYLILRDNERFRPQGGLQWGVTGLSVLIILLAGFTLVQTLTGDRPAAPRIAALSPQAEGVELNEPAPDFDFRLVKDDAPVDLASYRGKVVLLNFWATWCAPCLTEMPELNRLQEAYADEGLVVLTVSDEPRPELLAFEQQLPLETVSGYIADPTRLPQPFVRMLEARPMTFLIDRQGILREAMVGSRDFASFEQSIMPYLQQRIAAR